MMQYLHINDEFNLSLKCKRDKVEYSAKTYFPFFHKALILYEVCILGKRNQSIFIGIQQPMCPFKNEKRKIKKKLCGPPFLWLKILYIGLGAISKAEAKGQWEFHHLFGKELKKKKKPLSFEDRIDH